MERLRLFPDFGGADPLWAADGVGISLDTLPLRRATKAALRDWCAEWEPLARQQMDAEDFAAGMTDRAVDPVSDETWRAIEVEGRRLCAQVQRELGDQWEIGYEGPR
jgi:hypothetical protein